MGSTIRVRRHVRILMLVVSTFSASAALAQTTAFTYQGQLSDAGALANGSYDIRFALFESAGGGAQIGTDQTVPAVPVSNGIFTVQLDFGVNAFPGANRFVEIAVQPAGGGSFTILAPRQQISSSPYAIRTLSAATADALSSACVGCVQSAQINSVAGSKVSGTIPAASVPTGSGNYVQNTTTQQASANFNISGNGTASSMNVNGAFSLGGTSPPAPAAGQGRIYFDSASNKVKVSENGAAFVNLVGASGVSGNGTTNTIPLWSAGTTLGNSLITQSNGSVQLPNNVTLAAGAQGNNVGFGSPNSETGMTIAGSSGRADLRYDGTLKLVNGPGGIPLATNGIAITTDGNVGIGTEAPNGKLEVNAGGSGGVIRFHTPNAESGMSIIGTNRADVRFDGTTLKLLAGLNTTSPANGIAVDTSGRVGIGTFAPVTPLSVHGGHPWTVNSWAGSLSLQNASAIGWEANASGQHFGIGQSTGGLYFLRTNSAFNTTASPANYDMEIGDGGELHAYGNAEQARDKGGWVKAMIYVKEDGTVFRCFNSQMLDGGASLPPSGNTGCGFSVSAPLADFLDLGDSYGVDLGFEVGDRFVSVTPHTPINKLNISAVVYLAPGHTISVRIFTEPGTLHGGYGPFTLIVY